MNSLVITGRRWFNSREGNTYFSANVYVDGVMTVHIPFEYGYGSHFEWSAWVSLASKLNLDIKAPGSAHLLGARRYCDLHDITYVCEVTDVRRKKDL